MRQKAPPVAWAPAQWRWCNPLPHPGSGSLSRPAPRRRRHPPCAPPPQHREFNLRTPPTCSSMELDQEQCISPGGAARSNTEVRAVTGAGGSSLHLPQESGAVPGRLLLARPPASPSASAAHLLAPRCFCHAPRATVQGPCCRNCGVGGPHYPPHLWRRHPCTGERLCDACYGYSSTHGGAPRPGVEAAQQVGRGALWG